MKLLKKKIVIDDAGTLAGSHVTLLLYYSTDPEIWTHIRRNLRVHIAQPVTWQVKRNLKAKIDTPI